MSLGMIKDFDAPEAPDSPTASTTSGSLMAATKSRRSSRALLMRPRAFLRGGMLGEKVDKTSKASRASSGNKNEQTYAPEIAGINELEAEELPNRIPLSNIDEDQINDEVPSERKGLISSAAGMYRKGVSLASSLVWDKAEEGIKRITNIEEHFVLNDQVQPPSNEHVKVLHARTVANGQPVILKVIQKSFFAIVGEEKEWRKNAELMLKLKRSRFICEIYGIFEDKNAYFVSMEKVTGQDLYEVLTGKERLCEDDQKEVLRQILCGIRDLHSSCIHRDIKLENIMLARVRRGDIFIKIIDFDTIQPLSKAGHIVKDRKVTIVGTDQYIAPEAYEAQSIFTPSSDLFAVGVTAYILCSRKFPFQHKMFDDKPGENYVGSPKMHEIADRVRKADLNWEKDFRDNALAMDFCKQLMNNDPNERPSAEEALDHPWLDQGPAFGKALSMF
eukprot:symbB.v1.2.004600.t1/scaffold259.1/size252385/2